MILKWLWGAWGLLFDADNKNEVIVSDKDDPFPLDEEIWVWIFSILMAIFVLFRGKGVETSKKKIRQKRIKRVSK